VVLQKRIELLQIRMEREVRQNLHAKYSSFRAIHFVLLFDAKYPLCTLLGEKKIPLIKKTEFYREQNKTLLREKTVQESEHENRRARDAEQIEALTTKIQQLQGLLRENTRG
jgi:hypothetical protein